ncbi:ExbD/TolR family protein [Parendozoicomonas haliclonae]|uniref:Colicin uptake protein TolR n=1 Tax=Parendozoicomonas haliclonae TaxID=1960125 RepID=A0A1X7AMH7_9GAMM|nr:biopolymer transporter ExbD [Parendozoicomonas haliclonae]SMA49192.1 colicin uptake protein TolR [Parendozoicomonas haliclonae]
MKFRRQPVAEVSVNLTPLIDVVFLLLIFFMVSTTFTKETRLEVDLPEASASASVQEKREITIEISQTGVFAVAEQVLPGSSLEVVKAAISRASAGNTEIPLVISADAKTPHESVVTAMEAAGALGFSKLSIATRTPEAQP